MIYCQNLGSYQQVNPEKPERMIRQGCKWHINLSRPSKNNPNSLIFVTMFVNKHNHEMYSEVLQFEKLRTFTNEIKKDIEFYVKECNFGQVPNVFVTNGDLAIESAIVTEYPMTHHILCIWHLKENIKKTLRGKLSGSFNNFYSSFWKCHNADTPDVFYHYWEEMTNNYPTACTYLQNHLYNRRKSWARRFTTTLFTLGIESTSFVESQNACLKHIIESSNTSLYELGKVLINSVEDNIRQKHYKEITKDVPFTVNTITIFPKIESLISRYLRPNIVQFLVGQMKESVFYISFHSNIEEIQNMFMNKPSESDNFENEPDCVFLCAQFLLQQLDCSKIKEKKEIRSQQVDSSEDENSDKENTLPNIKLRNPRKVITRGESRINVATARGWVTILQHALKKLRISSFSSVHRWN
ncbi:23706_t:CDS:2 [Cetraspora pellucida]|uniref:23706_t:CDS:1 n=1 Tax=Cetraspora pellucida TaxID=1433469 RepID=A0A9N9I8H3_9GLOM|nr:23706_t:CDS:2 [Cetraspora pellucida]